MYSHHPEGKKTTHKQEKIFVNHIYDKGLLPRICKEPLQLSTPPKKGFEFSKREIWRANKHMKRTSVVIREMQMRYLFHTHQNGDNQKDSPEEVFGKDMEKLEPS